MSPTAAAVIMAHAREWSGPLGPLGEWPREPAMQRLAARLGPTAAPDLVGLVRAHVGELEGALYGLLEFSRAFAAQHPVETLAALRPLLGPACPTPIVDIVGATRLPEALEPLRELALAPDTTEENLIELFDALATFGTTEAHTIFSAIRTTGLSPEALREHEIACQIFAQKLSSSD